MTTVNLLTQTTVTLQNLCLNKIISEFSWYYKVYCYTEDSSSKLKFEFLKKKFSFDILKKLNEEDHLKVEYLDFLINTYLKVLNTEWLENWPFETVSQKLAEIGTNFEKVTFGGDRPWAEILCCLPNMRNVIFQEHCSDEFLVNLFKFCGSVEVLDVKFSFFGVTDSGFANLCCIPDKNASYSYLPIKELLILGTNVGRKGVAHVLKNMPDLQNIDYVQVPFVLYSMHKSDINAIDKVKPYNLTHLNLRFMNHKDIFHDILTVCVSVCPHLKSLSCSILQKQHLDLCSQLQELEELNLHCCEEPPLELNESLMLNWKNLTSLRIYNFCISLSVLAQNCPHLNLLEMDKVNLQHNVNDCVPVFHNLDKVFFEKFIFIEPVDSRAVACLLSSAPNLSYPCFISCELFSSDIKTQILRCCEQCKLTNINFTDSEVELTFVRDILLTCSTLGFLFLSKCEIARDDEAINELKTIATSLPNKPQICYIPNF